MASKYPRGVAELLQPLMEEGEQLHAATFAESRNPAAHHAHPNGQAQTVPKGDVLVAVTDRRLLVFPRKGFQVFEPFATVAPTEFYRVVFHSPVIGSPSLDLLFIDGSHSWFALPADNGGRFVAQYAMDIVANDSPSRDLSGVAPQPMASASLNTTGLVFADTLSLESLADLEAIKRTKYRYLRCLDQKLWDELPSCFTPDCVATYSGGKYTFEGADAIIDFLRRNMGAETFLSSHRVHQPEITMAGPATAVGTWAMDDVVIMTDMDLTVRGAGFYEDEYRRQDGIWRISRTGYKRTYEEIQPRGKVDGLQLTASWWGTGGQSQLDAG